MARRRAGKHNVIAGSPDYNEGVPGCPLTQVTVHIDHDNNKDGKITQLTMHLLLTKVMFKNNVRVPWRPLTVTVTQVTMYDNHMTTRSF